MNQLENSGLGPALPAQQPVVICVAPNGARRTKKDHPSIPMTASELGREAAACADAGASVIHLHVRSDAGTHSLDVEKYRAAIASVRELTNDRLLIQVTTEAVGIYEPHEQIRVVQELRPDAASVALKELIPDATHLSSSIEFFHWCGRHDVALQYIVYSPEEASRLHDMAKRGDLGCDSPNVLFVLGRYTEGQRSSSSDLLPFLAAWDCRYSWSTCAFGPTEALCMTAAIGLGGHLRVGFENNISLTDGKTAKSNAELVANVADIACRSGRGVGDLREARRIYGCSSSLRRVEL
ncbi:MAG: 3-keto-5-aminohexanoate cleavage protein [Simplicispira sp.]|jgi:3-keto-5-aminohexanoate cleavage enzyme|nr:3-keto-5-aminohexanoate cleavage protein [Simplicispira sp.]